MSATSTACEIHDEAGECTQECADLVNQMSPAIGVDFDPTGCSYPEPQMEEVAQFDAVRRAVIWVEVCPYEDSHDATACHVCGHMGF